MPIQNPFLFPADTLKYLPADSSTRCRSHPASKNVLPLLFRLQIGEIYIGNPHFLRQLIQEIFRSAITRSSLKIIAMTVSAPTRFRLFPLHLESRFNQTAEYEGQQPWQQDKAVCEDETAEGKEPQNRGIDIPKAAE